MDVWYRLGAFVARVRGVQYLKIMKTRQTMDNTLYRHALIFLVRTCERGGVRRTLGSRAPP